MHDSPAPPLSSPIHLPLPSSWTSCGPFLLPAHRYELLRANAECSSSETQASVADVPRRYKAYEGAYCLGENHVGLGWQWAYTVEACQAACNARASDPTPCTAFDMKVHDSGAYDYCILHSSTSFIPAYGTWDGFAYTCWHAIDDLEDRKQRCADKCAGKVDCNLFTFRESDRACWLEEATQRYCSEGWAESEGKNTYAIVRSGPYVSNSCTGRCEGADPAPLITQGASGLIIARLEEYPFTQYDWRLVVWCSGSERCTSLSLECKPPQHT